MSVTDRLNKLSTDITNAYTSIENKGGTIPSDKNTNNLSTAIDSIQSSNIIGATAEGESLSLTNTKAMPYSEYVVKGKSEQETRILPEEYTQVEYIKSTGTQYIDTGFNGGNNYTIKCKIQDVGRTTFVFSDYKDNVANENLGLYVLGSGTYGIYYTSTQKFLSSTAGDIKNIDFALNSTGLTYTINEETGTSSYTPTTNNGNVVLFRRGNSNTYYSSTKLYNFKIFNSSNTLVRNLIPCYRNSDNEIGLYDTVNNVFYTNQGTGTFLKGNNVSIPSPEYPSEIHSVADDVNLWNNELDNNVFNDNGIKEYSTIFVMNKVAIDVIPNTSYVVSQKEHPCQQRIIFLNNDTYLSRVNNTVDTTNGHTEFTFITPENCNKIHIMFRSTVEVISTTGSYFIQPDDITNVKIQKGTEATPYSPYNQGTVTIKQRGTTESNDYTIQTEPLRSLPNGVKDTIEEDGIHRRVGKQIVSNGNFYDGNTWKGYIVVLPNKKYASDSSLMCNRAKFVPKAQIEDGTVYENQGNIMFVGNNQDTLETLKDKYDGSEVLYELAEEVIEPLTQNQATTMLDIIKTGSYEGTTNIYTDEDVKPTIGVDYYKKG